jgi:predicted GIY-YIG superfamily endonuclease
MRKPNGYWTKERCAGAALKFETRSAFKKVCASAHVISCKNGWLNDICGHMLQINKPNGYWTKEKCHEAALKFESRSAFRKGCSAYYAAHENGWLDDICGHMETLGNKMKRGIYRCSFPDGYFYIGLTGNFKDREASHRRKGTVFKYIQATGMDFKFEILHSYMEAGKSAEIEKALIREGETKGYKMLNKAKGGTLGGGTLVWTKERCHKTTLKYKSRGVFRKAVSGAYAAAHKNGWLDDICGHMEPLLESWAFEKCHEAALKFETRSAFQKGCASAYSAAYRNVWLNDICRHMPEINKPNGYWTKEKCHEAALKFESRSSFLKGRSAAHSAASKKGWMDDICGHMKDLRGIKK